MRTAIHDLRQALSQRFPQAVVAEQTQESGVTEIVGPAGAGGCTLALERIAEVLSHGDRWAAWIQLPSGRGGELYPPAAAALGVPLWRLLVVRTADRSVAFRVAEALLRGGAARFVAIDLPDDARPLRLGTYHRLRRRALQSRAALVFLSVRSVVPADHRIDLSQPAVARREVA